MYISRWRYISVAAVIVLGILYALPNMLSEERLKRLPSWMPNQTINLGLELRGGSHLQLEIDLASVVKERMGSVLEDVRKKLRDAKVGYVGLAVQGQQVSLKLREVGDVETARKALRRMDEGISVTVTKTGDVTVGYDEVGLAALRRTIVEQSISVIRSRVDESGTKEPVIQRQGEDRIILQLPGVDNPEDIKRILGRTAKLSFRVLDESMADVPAAESGAPMGVAPPGSEMVMEEMRNGMKIYHAVKKQIYVGGETLVDARATTDQYGQPAVSLKFNSTGARKFAEMSTQYLKKRFAIVLDDRVISSPRFVSQIPDGQGQITGSFTIQEASELALLLRAGALPASLKFVEERTVGPNLGADSIAAGRLATLLGIVFVAIFMFLTYSLFGVIADIALFVNLILLFAALSLLGATLTLPGIAGIALTVGMAVDANVLIYERIKEELRHGAKVFAAIEAGFSRAVTTIVDSNLTTLIGSAVLFEFGSGPIRGFAVTLALGILISMFTAIVLSKMLIMTWYDKKRPTVLPI